MKKLLVIAMCMATLYGASAQTFHGSVGAYHGPVYVYRPAVGIGLGYYSPYYNPYGLYSYPYGFYNPNGSATAHLSKLQMKEEDIRSDYADRIYSVRHDASLSSKEKRQTVHLLKKQRKQDIRDLVANYHKK